MRLRTFRTLPALTCAVVLTLTACGSSSGGSSATSTGAAKPSPNATASGPAGAYCTSLAGFLNDTKSLATSALSGRSSEARTRVEKARRQADSVVAASPPEIKQDMTTLVNAATSYFDALAAAGYDARKVDFSKLKALSSGDVLQASEQVTAYVHSRCGIDVSAAF